MTADATRRPSVAVDGTAPLLKGNGHLLVAYDRFDATAQFGVVLQAEQTAAVVYLFAPDAANLAAYQATVSATDKATPAFVAKMTSHQVLGSESPAGAKEIETILGGLKQLPALRKGVQARVLTPLEALGADSQGPADTIELFLIQTKSVKPTPTK